MKARKSRKPGKPLYIALWLTVPIYIHFRRPRYPSKRRPLELSKYLVSRPGRVNVVPLVLPSWCHCTVPSLWWHVARSSHDSSAVLLEIPSQAEIDDNNIPQEPRGFHAFFRLPQKNAESQLKAQDRCGTNARIFEHDTGKGCILCCPMASKTGRSYYILDLDHLRYITSGTGKSHVLEFGQTCCRCRHLRNVGSVTGFAFWGQKLFSQVDKKWPSRHFPVIYIQDDGLGLFFSKARTLPVSVSRNHHIWLLDVTMHASVVVEIQDACLSCRIFFMNFWGLKNGPSCVKPLGTAQKSQNPTASTAEMHRPAAGFRRARADSRQLHSGWPSVRPS